MNEETKQKSAIKRLGEQIVGVFGWVREQWQANPLALILVVVLLVTLALIIRETNNRNNLGLGDKTFWDWMELLIIPIVLAVGAWWLNKSEREEDREIARQNREQDREIADDRRNQATLEAYFDRMTELLLEKELRESDEVQTVARTRTLAVLRSLDGSRKGQVVQFLHEALLIDSRSTFVQLHEADLGGADLSRAFLPDVNLNGANLMGADLSGAMLPGADLSGKTNLSKANLVRAVLISANLVGTNMTGADLSGGTLAEANLEGANLTEANLKGAYLNGANLEYAKVTDEQLAQAASLAGATLPNGTKVPDEETADEQE